MSEVENPFLLKKSEYKRDLNYLKYYVEDSAQYLSISTGKPIEVCKAFVTSNLKAGGKFAFKDPKIKFLRRGENGDRLEEEGTLERYISQSIKSRELIAPTLTTYIHPDIKQSILSLAIDEGVAQRKTAKKEMFEARANKLMLLESIKNIEQTGKKLGNNAISGAHVSPSTPLHNKTAHSTLTSNCRTTAAYGNANNEKFLSGNRHYFNHHIVLNNIVSIINNTDYIALAAVIEKYNLTLPSVEETLNCIRYSTGLYFWEIQYFEKIKALVYKLNPLQRAAFVYTGDFYHLMKYNESFVRLFLTQLASKVYGEHPEPATVLKRAREDHLNLANRICSKEMKGIGKDYSKLKDTPAHSTLALTVENIEKTVLKYADMIKVFWVTSNMPTSVANFTNSIRRSAITGDTDSTIFTVQDWVIWYEGKISFSEEALAIKEAVVFLTASTITHLLAMMSANFGIVEKRLFQISMKNEYAFDVFVPSNLGKHYFALMSAQEGNIYEKDKMEIKGVGLKSSNSPKEIIAEAQAMMRSIMEDVKKKGTISVFQYIRQVADVERKIISSIQKGEHTYLRRGSIKDASSYTATEDLSPYMQYKLYKDVFAPKYGEIEPPPYNTLKISVDINNATDFQNWIAKIEDRAFADRMSKWLAETGRTHMSTFNFPSQILNSSGMPKELLDIVAYRRIVSDICKIFYIVLECLGVYTAEKKVVRLLSDYY
jgi:hypothetical protein